MSLHTSKLFTRSLTLAAAAALFIHVGGATAADSTGDTQQQIKAVLTGTNTTHFAVQSGSRDSKATNVVADAQESVKQVLLGTSSSGRRGNEAIEHTEVAKASTATGPQQRKSAYSDTQTTVQQILLGQHVASNASLLASRSTR